MSVTTTADERVAEAKQKVVDARRLVGEVFAEQEEMWGAKDFKRGYVRRLLFKLDDAMDAFDGGDPPGDGGEA